MNKKFFLFLALGLFFFSCQKEERSITPVTEEEGFLEGNSGLLNLMRSVSLKDGSIDNAIDSTSALSVVFPIQVKINGEQMEIDSAAEVEAEMDEYSDELELIFPLVTVADNFSEITFFDAGQLRQYREENPAPGNDIEAVDFEYPISFAAYSLDSQLAETIPVEDDEDLFFFLENLSDVYVASLNYPITLKYYDGRNLNIPSNGDLEAGLLDVPADYDEMDDPYNQDKIEPALLGCSWAFSGTSFDLVFLNDGTFDVEEGLATGTWDLQIGKEDILTLSVENINYSFEGEWTISAFEARSEGYLLHFSNGTDLSLKQHCPDEPCTTTIVECETQPGYAQFNLNAYKNCAAILAGMDPETAQVNYFDSLSGAQNNDNPINNTIAYTNQTPNSQTIYARVKDPATQEIVIITILLQVEEC